MWKFFINNNRFAYLFLVGLIGVGTYSIFSIPRESAPEVVIPVGIVTTVLPGAQASDIESLITNELERGLVSLENVKNITSVSRESVSSITIEFEADADLDESIAELKDEVDILKQELPEEAEDPFVTEVNFVNQPIMSIALSGDLSGLAFSDLAKRVEDELESITGVSRVVSNGVREQEISIIVDQTKLFRYNLSLNQVISAVRDANLTLPIGQIESDGVAYNIAFEGDLKNSEDILNTSVGRVGGQPVFIRDIAVVEDGLAPASSLTRLSLDSTPSEPAITLDVYKQTGGDITKIAKSVNQKLDDLQNSGGLLTDVHVLTVLDAGRDIQTDLIRLSTSGLQTVVLVILLLIVAIGWREGLLAGTAIPLSFLFGFIGLYFSGNTINFLSLFSLILGIGILVDSAIVMVEGINRKMKDDPTIDKRQAALSTIDEFKAPLISGTLTTVSMFVGLFIVSGIIGQFIASIPFTLIFLLFSAMFVALAIVPLLASNFLRRRSETQFEQLQVEYAHRFENWYRSKLDNILGDKRKERIFRWSLRIALILALLLPVTGVVKVIFFEQSDIDYLIVEIEYPEGTTKEVTDIGLRRVEEVLYTEPEIESFVSYVGGGSQFASAGTGEKLANIFITLKDDRKRNSTEVLSDLRVGLQDIRDIKVTAVQLNDGPPTGAPIIMKYLGDDLNELTRIANETSNLFRSVEGVINVESSTNSNNTEYVLELDRVKAAALGLDAFTISQIARTAVFGTDATSITTLDEDIDVVVKLNIDQSFAVTGENTNQTTIDALNRISIQTAAGEVPLSSLVTVSLRESKSSINHEDNERVVTVTADVAEDYNAREIQAELLMRVNQEIDIPAGINLSTGGGEAEESNKAFIEMFLALVVGILLMIAILVLQFNSYLHMRYVLTILPYSLIGIMLGLALTRSPLSFPSMMGFIALSGIVVNNSILLIDMMNNMRMKEPLKSIRDVVLDSAANRLRPILLTTITTVVGMVPLTYSGDLWAPLAYAVMFGLLFSVVITLLLIPIIYYNKPGEVMQNKL